MGLVSGYVGLKLDIGEDRNFKLRVCPLVWRADIDQTISPNLQLRGGIYGAVTSYGVDLELWEDDQKKDNWIHHHPLKRFLRSRMLTLNNKQRAGQKFNGNPMTMLV